MSSQSCRSPKAGTERITDELAHRLGDRVVTSAEVLEVIDHGDYRLDAGIATMGMSSRSLRKAVVMAAPPAAVAETVVDLPAATRHALESVNWGANHRRECLPRPGIHLAELGWHPVR